MEGFLQCIALGLLGALVAIVLRDRAKEQAVLLTIACCGLMFAVAARFLQPVAELLARLRRAGNLDGDMVAILLKTAGVALLTEVGDTVCDDAGEGSLGKMIRVCGGAAALYLALPLLTAVLDLLEQMIGG